MAEQFVALGLEDVTIDACGNALGWMRAGNDSAEKDAEEFRLCTLFSAHLDTVFPADAIGQPVQDGNRLTIPGASDNCAGITALLGIAAGVQCRRRGRR